MQNKFFKIFGLNGFLESAEGYIDSKLQIIKLEVHEKLTNAMTFMLMFICIIFLFLMSIAFLSVALGFFLNSLLNSTYLGFLLIGVFFLILILILLFSKKTIHKKIHRITGHFMDITNSKHD